MSFTHFIHSKQLLFLLKLLFLCIMLLTITSLYPALAAQSSDSTNIRTSSSSYHVTSQSNMNHNSNSTENRSTAKMDMKAIISTVVISLTVIVLVFLYNIYTIKKIRKARNEKKVKYSYRDFNGITGFSPAPDGPISLPGNHTEEITEEIKNSDTHFNSNDFVAFSKEVFLTLQKGLTERNWSAIRPFEHDELFRIHHAQIQEDIREEQISVTDQINITNAHLHLYKRDSEYETLTVYMGVSLREYTIDDKKRVLISGYDDETYRIHYLLTFMRKTGITTNCETDAISSAVCPHCGKPLRLEDTGKCKYCGINITNGEYGWILRDLTRLKDFTNLDERGVVLY